MVIGLSEVSVPQDEGNTSNSRILVCMMMEMLVKKKPLMIENDVDEVYVNYQSGVKRFYSIMLGDDNGSGLGNMVDVGVEDSYKISRAFDYSYTEEEEDEEETQFVNLDDKTEELDINNFVGDLRSLMVEDSEDVGVLDSDDDEVISEKKDRRGGLLWRRASAVSTPSLEVKSSAGSNLTDKVTDNGPKSLQADTCFQEVLTGISNNANAAKVDHDENACYNNSENVNEIVDDSPEPGESTQANALRFVDHYLSISVENLSPEVKIPKTNGPRSPFTSFAKGSHELVKKANRMNQIGVPTFDWNANLILEKEKEPNIQKNIHLDGRSLDQHFEEELPKCPSGNDMFDASFNTQMAAEVIESLLYVPPPTFDVDETLKQVSFPLTDATNFNRNEPNVESLTENVKKSHDKPLKVFTKRKKNQDSKKENVQYVYTRRGSHRETQKAKTFSPVATRTRRGSSVKVSKRTEHSCNLENITHGNIKFEAWNWPKKKRTCRNTRQNATLSGNRVSVVGPSETEGSLKEAFLMSSVTRKARSASKFRSAVRNKSWKGSLMQDIGQLSLAEVTNTKHVAESSPDSITKDLRKRRKRVEVRVLFSQNLEDDVVKQQRKVMKKLGISIAKDCSDATHFVSDRFARTKNMLEAMAFGKPVVTPSWLESCEQAACIIDEKIYILRDTKKEKEIGFNMPVSLSRARSHPLLKDQRVLVTSSVEPDREMIKNLVKASQGKVMEGVKQARMEYKISDDLLILSCEKDYEVCVPFLDKGAKVYSSELLLNGIIIQKLDYARHQIFNAHVKMKRYAGKRMRIGMHINGP
ncbi:uncharacterized protein LOC143543957 [Bidens hawaiensis]|uniref:uncharacterized protein LOC143543957 n=1 Tax=Bidens hawaiensis TaxID=980011 RepID=UPI004049AF3A